MWIDFFTYFLHTIGMINLSPRTRAMTYIEQKLNPIIEPLVSATFIELNKDPKLNFVSTRTIFNI